MFAEYDITCNMAYTLGVALTVLANVHSCWQTGAVFRDRVNQLVKDRDLSFMSVVNEYFNMSGNL